MTSRTRVLLEDLNRSSQSFYDQSKNPQLSSLQEIIKTRKRTPSSMKLTQQRVRAKSRYEDLTDKTKQQQTSMIWDFMQTQRKSKKDWSYAYYTGNNKRADVSKTFGVYQRGYLDQYPDNNTKYNIQFLDRSIHGSNLRFPRSQSGEFKKPSNSLCSKHYQPIVKQKVKLNEDWELMPSKYGKIYLDHKRDRIINQYHIQANPFRTPRSNSLISKISKSQLY